ncbi:hypothetical protein [Bacillus sp. RO1]|uniref:hypothetical protein n=1 Tax=Bacillus sp. RO1 TaxID=2722703 RepID=UPI0014565320|nr:hypothetical protein [Bacillus sp. RO1]NLP49171.1 hypothetical protein [Bacillus sp. RO1]
MVVMKTSMTRKKDEVLITVMKTSVTRKKGERSPHGGNEDLSDEGRGGEKSSSP